MAGRGVRDVQPWLDEAFATYGEAFANDAYEDYAEAAEPGGPRIDRPMTYWNDHRSRYGAVVYTEGAGALVRARSAARSRGAWDDALRCYVRANAFRVATAADLQRAIAHLPEAVRELQRYGALG